ncbi:MAG: hypothetical protein AB4368_15360 [Xenococcaceae cyanobacterium]
MFIGINVYHPQRDRTLAEHLTIGTADPLPLGLAILGSQLPDLDTTESTIGKIFFSSQQLDRG